jgi:hypothetical protein
VLLVGENLVALLVRKKSLAITISLAILCWLVLYPVVIFLFENELPAGAKEGNFDFVVSFKN